MGENHQLFFGKLSKSCLYPKVYLAWYFCSSYKFKSCLYPKVYLAWFLCSSHKLHVFKISCKPICIVFKVPMNFPCKELNSELCPDFSEEHYQKIIEKCRVNCIWMHVRILKGAQTISMVDPDSWTVSQNVTHLLITIYQCELIDWVPCCIPLLSFALIWLFFQNS